MVLREPTETGAIELSFRNLPDVKIAYAGGLGVYDLLRRRVVSRPTGRCLRSFTADGRSTRCDEDGKEVASHEDSLAT